MKYISTEEVMTTKLSCNHPKVKRIWEYGGLSAIPTQGDMFRAVCLLMENGERKEFIDDGNGDAILEAEKYLATI